VRTCTPTWLALATLGQLDDARFRQKETSGGSSETEVNEVAVKPTGVSPDTVITTTPAACRRRSERNRSGPIVVVIRYLRGDVESDRIGFDRPPDYH
jgi:hypothetical protein